MPTYAYACTQCDHRFEAVQSFTDAALTECPECSGKLRKLFNAVGIVFKGSGFYRTDNRSSSSGKSSSTTSTSSASSTSGSSSTTSTSSSSSNGSSSGTTSSSTSASAAS
ncbi:FmdB family zinc ribbon protein [Streptoalloteichus hindustanus]|uniref:Putative regulatory protein, FmdB family n=1 Tax=Streptoalloteichus hindustanus TaxID=2017 RepID=A0A1M5KXF2_STRHI|nr:FmdB family zinc ribbon protein [Streptoalloteichus hindustanus]SHG57532.1 putative regulatory protein, FmdB family [Streptoalloteichus hindustanus]